MLLSNGEQVKKAWNESSKAWTEFVRTGKDYYRDGLNNPTTFDLIGDVKGLVVLDLACGEGYNTRMLARKGARITGVDFSKNMIQYARLEEEKEKLDIQYLILDAAHLQGLADGYFDLVTCFMALHDIQNFRRAISEVSRVLKPRGRFVFSIPHPCFEKIQLKGKRIDAADNYFETVKHVIEWNMERLSIPFQTISFHRTLTDYFDALNRSRLHVSRLVEPRVPEKAYREDPYFRDVLKRPQSVVIAAVKAAL